SLGALLGAAIAACSAGNDSHGASDTPHISDPAAIDTRPRWVLRTDRSGSSIVRFDVPSKTTIIELGRVGTNSSWSDDGTALAAWTGTQMILARMDENFEPRAVDVSLSYYSEGPLWI